MKDVDQKKLEEAIAALPPHLAARVMPALASGSVRDLIPVLRHVHGELGQLIENLESAVAGGGKQ